MNTLDIEQFLSIGVERYIQRGYDINAVNQDGWSLIETVLNWDQLLNYHENIPNARRILLEQPSLNTYTDRAQKLLWHCLDDISMPGGEDKRHVFIHKFDLTRLIERERFSFKNGSDYTYTSHWLYDFMRDRRVDLFYEAALRHKDFKQALPFVDNEKNNLWHLYVESYFYNIFSGYKQECHTNTAKILVEHYPQGLILPNAKGLLPIDCAARDLSRNKKNNSNFYAPQQTLYDFIETITQKLQLENKLSLQLGNSAVQFKI